MSSAALTRRLKERAREEGFDAVAVSDARELDRDAATLAAWLGGSREAGMSWMAREPGKRSDPRLLLDGCRSVVSVAMNYWQRETAQAAIGRVARYARGRDYHRVLGRKLERLSTWLAAESGGEVRRFVDTGPVLERAWAERSGIGWIGKNANLLLRDRGSWVLLGELLTTAELQADPGPHADFCGSCTACIEGCPTDAIVEPGVVDSNLCISYWTIERRGSIPEAMRPGLDDWIFGCDVCQDVCPWNHKFAGPATNDPFEYRSDLAALDPVEILGMDEATFRARYSGTPLMRAKWEGMRRNACVVLGNSGDERYLGPLSAALGDPDPVIRSHAGWAIGHIGGEQARKILSGAEEAEIDDEVRVELTRAIAAGDTPE
jgi:epoxyqueuosine reductase